MKSFIVALSMAVAGVGFVAVPLDAEAKRIGGGKSVGMQRQAPSKPADTSSQTPAQPANAAPTAGAAAPAAAGVAAAAGKRSWLGPIAGLAAGLGIAALMSHLGLGEGFGNMLTMLLMAAAAFFVIRWLLRRFAGGQQRPAGGLQYAGAAATAGHGTASPQPFAQQQPQHQQLKASLAKPSADLGAGGLPPTGGAFPAGFDVQGFERVAKMLFIRLQAANDAGQLDDLRKFTTPEMFAAVRLDLQERGQAAQQTDVVQLDAEVLDSAQQNGDWVVSVRFKGLIREQAEATAEPFDELWHFVRPADESRDWAIAGITQNL
ncbi:Tim44 domain-containing protein [Caldimonas brevitalea]|uniref:Preprotein translocase subunit Tim44 n=1 Tax=Caldimonas brevitalea TaxID=413882 RepID=A0A0G3BJ75_9BURK|nr:Tim44-like domain-containing protein [Caldimonas brevitalea]AKJ27421.1 preprotein translocase subunit Tim44 [Caldimonas brevitalea]